MKLKCHLASFSVLAFFLVSLDLVAGAEAKEERRHFEFTRMLAHWANYADPGYLAFVDETKPALVQLGFFGCINSLPALPEVRQSFIGTRLPIQWGKVLATRNSK